MLLIEGLRSLQRPTYLQTPIGGHHHQLRSLDLVGQLTNKVAARVPGDWWEKAQTVKVQMCHRKVHASWIRVGWEGGSTGWCH